MQEKESPTNYSLSQTLTCLLELSDKIDQPTGGVLYAISKNKKKLLDNSKQVEEARMALITDRCELTEDGKPLEKNQGSVNDKGEEIPTVVWKDEASMSSFVEEYASLMNTKNEDFKFFKIPLSIWNDVKIKKDESVSNLDYFVEYMIDEEK